MNYSLSKRASTHLYIESDPAPSAVSGPSTIGWKAGAKRDLQISREVDLVHG